MSTDQTPALARAESAIYVHARVGSGGARAVAHAAVSAALHDPDGAIVAALRTEFGYQMRTSAAHGRAGRRITDEDIASAATTALAKVRAAILGEA